MYIQLHSTRIISISQIKGLTVIDGQPLIFRVISVLESVAEEEELVFDGIHPIDPVVYSWTCGEFVWDALSEKFLVKVAVHLVEEILCAAVNRDVQGAWLKEMRHIDDCVLLPALRELLL